MDEMKEAHNKRKLAIQAERDARQKRLKNAREELTIGIAELSNTHNFLSTLDMERHQGKGKGDNNLANAIQNLATALTALNAYLKGYKDEEN